MQRSYPYLCAQRSRSTPGMVVTMPRPSRPRIRATPRTTPPHSGLSKGLSVLRRLPAASMTSRSSSSGVTGALFRHTRLLRQHSPSSSSARHKIVIPSLSSFAGEEGYVKSDASEYEQHRRLPSEVAQFIPPENAAEMHRAQQLDTFRDANDHMIQKMWRDSKAHLRKQQKLVAEFGVEGAVRETLQPSGTSFREQLRQRPLDRAILQEIYLGLHGRRIERKLKRGVSWEHWITKGDGTAPVFNTSHKAQQTFAFGGNIQQVRCATHPSQFPTLLARGSPSAAASSPLRDFSQTRQRNGKAGAAPRPHHRIKRAFVPRDDLLPEVAFVGRTSSGKSSLINAIVNAMITPYGHLRGTTSAVRFYHVAHRLTLVDCPGFGHYDPMQTPELDALNAMKAMRAYLACAAAPGAVQRYRLKQPTTTTDGAEKNLASVGEAGALDGDAAEDISISVSVGDGVSPSSHVSHSRHNGRAKRRGTVAPSAPVRYQPRNVKRVFVCVPSHGMQHLDYAYCDLLEAYQIPFSVVLTKTDAAPIRFLARLTDHTRSQLVRYTQCKEILLTSSLRVAGIDKMQELLASFAASEDPLHGATADFSAIV